MEPMSFRAKLDNFWYYYKVHTLVGVGLAVLILIAVFSSRSSGPPVGLTVDVIGAQGVGSQNELTAIQHSAAVSVFGAAGAKQHSVGLNVLPMAGTLQSPSNSNVEMSFMAHLAGKSIDVVIADPTDFKSFSRNHMLVNLANMPALTQWVGGADRPATSNTIYGLPVNVAKRLNAGLGMPAGSMMGIVANTQNKALAVRFLAWAMQS